MTEKRSTGITTTGKKVTTGKTPQPKIVPPKPKKS
jgi:hypothetical protein